MNLIICASILLLVPFSEARSHSLHSQIRRFEELLNEDKRVIGGEETTSDEEQPWLVMLEGDKEGWFTGSVFCGGSVISDRCVLSAAHCFEDVSSASRWTARLASRKRSGGLLDKIGHVVGSIIGKKEWQEFDIDVDRIIRHPQYMPGSSSLWLNDLAVLKLEDPVPAGEEFSQIRSINLPSQGDSSWPADNQDCMMLGWGCDSAGGSVMDRTMKVTLPKLSDRECSATWGIRATTRLCAGEHYGSKGICPGDSGGPLLCKKSGAWTQAGIASFTSANDPGNRPGAFTRVSAYADWIKQACGM